MEKNIRLLSFIMALSALTSAFCLQANADNAYASSSMETMYNQLGSWIIRGGFAKVSPTNDSSYSTGGIPNQKIKANSNTQIGVSLTYMFTDHFGLELLAATPFKHKLKLQGGAKVGTTKLLPPTISAEYYFAPPSSRWQPYIGMGINYTYFYHEKLDSSLKSSYHKLKLSDSLGLAGQAGIDFYINSQWLINASVMYANITTTGQLSNYGGGETKVKTNLNPWIYRINFGYRF